VNKILSCLLLLLLLAAATTRADDQKLRNDLEARRARVLAALDKNAVLLLRSRKPAHFSGDIHYEFREDNNLYYLTGLNQQGTYLVMSNHTMGNLGKVMLFTRTGRGKGVISYADRRLTLEEVSARTGIPEKCILGPADLEKFLARALGIKGKGKKISAKRLLYYDRRGAERSGITEIDKAHSLVLRLRHNRAGRRKIKSSRTLIDPLRRIKSPYEIECIRKAIKATEAGLTAAIRQMRPGMFEYEVEAIIEFHYRRLGCEHMAFPSIVGSGPNSCILHYSACRRKLEAGDLVVMDVGGDYRHYAADITRTVPVSGKFTQRQRAMYDLVLKAQIAAIRAVKPGVSFGETDRVARKIIGEGLKNLGLIKSSVHARRYFPHGTSHTLGMDAHDIPAGKLETGMVLTVEPGIYIAEEALGIRIEDDVLVTEKGAEVLSIGVAKRAEEIEALMAER